MVMSLVDAGSVTLYPWPTYDFLRIHCNIRGERAGRIAFGAELEKFVNSRGF